MTNLDDVVIFVKVAQFESISAAARSLGMPISTVSRRLSVLESKLGVSLLRRTTRRVTLTAQGREYFNQCTEPLILLEEAERVLTLGQKAPEGSLRVSVPVILGQEAFLEFLSEFLKTQPRIRIDLFITNLFLDLVAENIDVAIRFGELEDSSAVATRIGKSVRYVVAAPDYLKGRKASCRACGPRAATSIRSALSCTGVTGLDCCRQPTVTKHSRAVHSYGSCRGGLPRRSPSSPSTRIGNSCL